MRTLTIISVLFTLLAGIGWAQQVPVRSGDHPSFSRLAISIPVSQSWSATKTSRKVVLTLPDFSGDFDLSEIFLRMKRNRISDVTQSGPDLNLTLNCDCMASVFRSGSLLVLDIADKGVKLSTPVLGAPKRPRARANAARIARVENDTTNLPWIGGTSPFSIPTSKDHFWSPSTQLENVDPQLGVRSEILAQTQQVLIENVADAASRGLLENSHNAPSPGGKTIDNIETVTENEPLTLPLVVQAPPRNIRIRNSMTSSSNTDQTLQASRPSHKSCPQSDLFAIDMWADDTGFSAQIGPARNSLVNARDQLDLAAAKHLARLYLYFGFGAEAAAILRLDPELRAANTHLAIAAQILEYGSIDGSQALEGYLNCDSNIALWAILSLKTLPKDLQINTDAALRSLNNLPKHLRQILAPALSDRLLKYGAAPAAASAMRSIERLPEPLTQKAKMAQADLALDAGDTAQGILEEIVTANSLHSPEALIKLVEGKLARDEPLSYETTTLIDAYVQELRGTSLGDELRQTQVIALSQTQHFSRSFDMLNDLESTLSPLTHLHLKQEVFRQLGKKAEDATFLDHIFAEDFLEFDAFSDEVKLLLATRLMDLGFSAQVQQLLALVPDTSRAPARQLLAARAALSLSQPFQAQAALIGVTDPKAALLLARAKEMSGAYNEASQIYAQNDAPEKAAQAAWLSDEWGSLMLSESPEFSEIASLTRSKPLDEEAGLGQLGRANIALKESGEARSTLNELLLSTAIQTAPEP